jgi:N-acetylneuraminate synthase/N,N'-diacetyllegionaminate synthase
MKEIVLNDGRRIGNGYPSYIIVDVAANHNNDQATAKELVKKAAEAGADAVKFQTYTAENLYSKKAPKFSRDPVNPYDLIKQVEHPRSWLPILSEYAKKLGIHFLSSPFDYEAVDLLEDLDVPLFKVASAEIVDTKLIGYMAQKGRPMVLSTGMSNLGDIEDAVKAVRSEGNENIILLHCNTIYPTPPAAVNLLAMDTIREAFKLPVGFSDHTLGWHVSLAAVSRGACVIEKHFTLNRDQKGPDHSFSMEPEELGRMVSEIRDIEAAMGNGEKKVSEGEQENYKKGRRSIIARKAIPKGTPITEDMLVIKRPGYGIKPKYINMVTGRMAKVDIGEDDIITWDMLV